MKQVGVIVFALFMLMPVLAVSQGLTGYMKVDEVVGGTTTPPAYVGWSEITGLDWAINTNYSSGGGAGGAIVSPPSFKMSVTMPLDRASGQFAKRQALGQNSDTVTIDLLDVNKNTNAKYVYQRFTLINAFFVENLNSWTEASAQIPQVTVSLRFTKIKVEHFIINKAGGRVKTGEWTYNLATGGA
jgi:type VI protein secretion system component Hcp